nr:glutaminyl-peptide cyclotransferase [uncultured Flavobacterium sp.]
MINIRLQSIIFSTCLCFIACHKKEVVNLSEKKSKSVDFETINVYNHGVNSFTEGLFIDNGIIYESTGSPDDLPNTKSEFGILNLKTGIINSKAELDKNVFFGEGIAKCNEKIYQLTYKNKTGFIYDARTFKEIGMFQFESNEGWGLTNVKDELLIMSDGSNILTFLDPKSLKIIKKIEVFDNGIPIPNLNELEYVDGYIYANVYTTNKIVKIDAKSGIVVRTIDFTALYNDSKRKFSGSLEMNGIAYDTNKRTFLITGKMWPTLYEIKIID